MSELGGHFDDYADHHRNPWNKATHYLGIPTLALALFGLASKVALPGLPGGGPWDLGLLLVVALTVAYLRWHAGLALGTGLLLAATWLAGGRLPVVWLWPLLAAGVALQYIGHFVFEKRAPAFHRNLVHTMVGPLWVAARLFRAVGVYRGR